MGEPVSLNSLSPQELVQARRRRLPPAPPNVDRLPIACLLPFAVSAPLHSCMHLISPADTPAMLELAQLRQSLESELQAMTQNAVTLNATAAKFGAAGMAVEYLQEQKQGEAGVGVGRGATAALAL